MKTYEIGISYCNGVTLAHPHLGIRETTAEYADLLAEAVEPSNEAKHAKHIRMVTLIARDDDDKVVHLINTGVISCPHIKDEL